MRAETRTDINDQQQHGVAFAFQDQLVRAELMGIAGNDQISPDAGSAIDGADPQVGCRAAALLVGALVRLSRRRPSRSARHG